MFEIFDSSRTYTLPNGVIYSGNDLKEKSGYELLKNVPCVVNVTGGVMTSMQSLAAFAEQYGVEYEGKEEDILAKTIEAKNKQEEENAKERATIFDIQAQMDALCGIGGNMTPEELNLRTSMLTQIRMAASMSMQWQQASLTDEQAMAVSTLWPEWSAASVQYKVDDIVRYSTRLYRCEQAHTSQADWTPPAAPSLWSRIDIAGDGVEVWTQPTGAHNAYNVGDRVHYPMKDDPIYVSKIDGNVWAPDAYPQGWEIESE